MTVAPPATRRGAMASAAVCGTARNTSSHAASAGSSCVAKARSVAPAKPGYSASTRVPASSLDVATASSRSGWRSTRRTSSMPANPAAPTIPVLMAMSIPRLLVAPDVLSNLPGAKLLSCICTKVRRDIITDHRKKEPHVWQGGK